MPTNEQVIRALDRLLSAALRQSPELASSIATVAEWVAEVSRAHAVPIAQEEQGGPPPSATVEAKPAQETVAIPVAKAATSVVLVPPVDAVAGPTAFVPLKLGGEVRQLRLPGTSADIAAARKSAMEPEPPARRPDSRPIELGLIGARCALKAEACRVFIERRAAEGGPGEPEQRERIRGLLASAKKMENCFLWMVYPGKAQPGDDDLRVIGGVYDNLALAARCVEAAERRPDDREAEILAVNLLAEAQSAVRVVLAERSWLDRPDIDQDEAFGWLREKTLSASILVKHHMRMDDPADPEAWEDLKERITDAAGDLDRAASRETGVKNAIGKLRYHARRIAAGLSDRAEWDAAQTAVESLQDLGIAATDRRVRDQLASIADQLPDDFEASPGFDRAMEAAQVRADRNERIETPRQPSPTVLRVREWLRRGRIVMIGGEPREHAKARLIRAFELGEVAWPDVAEHASSEHFRADIAHSQTRLVVVLLRLTGHDHVEDAREFCRKHRKSLVVLRAGYNPEQVAAGVVEQASDQL